MARPAATPADGNLAVLWVPTLTAAAPTVAQVTAGGVVDLSCYLTPDGFAPSTDEQEITDDRLCDTQTFENRGRSKDSLTLKYVFNMLSTPDNVAYSTLKVPGTAGYIVARWGRPYSVAMATGHVVDVYTVTTGIPAKQAPEANSVLRVQQRMFVTNNTVRDVALT